MTTKKVENYKATARNNAEKTKNAAQIAAGDFLYLVTGYGKENGLRDYIRTPERGNSPTLVKVVAVVDVPESFDLLRGWMAQPAPEHRGGSQLDDITEDHTPYNYTPEEISTFFQLVTVYRNSKGQFIAVDCQGYDYWRYVYLSAYWREMFAEETEQITKELEAERVAMIEAQSPVTVEAYRNRLYKKLSKVLADNNIDEQRIITEAAIFSEKIAVDEETVRLRSHIAQLRDILESDESVGRKLDFIVQEINREINTIGSKAQDLNITKIVVDTKSDIEKIREQIQNVE